MALSRAAFSVPYVSYATVNSAKQAPDANGNGCVLWKYCVATIPTPWVVMRMPPILFQLTDSRQGLINIRQNIGN